MICLWLWTGKAHDRDHKLNQQQPTTSSESLDPRCVSEVTGVIGAQTTLGGASGLSTSWRNGVGSQWNDILQCEFLHINIVFVAEVCVPSKYIKCGCT